MRGVFDDREFQQALPRQDRELTLSSTALLLIFFGLVLLCGLCFGLGYAMGHRGAKDAGIVQQAPGAAQTATHADTGRPKPATNPQPDAGIAQQDAAVDQPQAGIAGQSMQSAAVAAAGGSAGASPPVKPVFGAELNPAPAVQPASSQVEPALVPAGSLMVQIATISQQEDADVLVGALRRHGYAVAARRDPLDGLIHVRVGPFKTRDEAEKWRQKLLNDGYNAIVQP
jgi:cell division septation protein DedD